MYSRSVGPLRRNTQDPECQVVVKLKQTRAVRGTLSAVASEGRMPARSGPLSRALASKKLLAMEPIFGEAPARGVSGLRRMAVAATSEKEAALAGLNVMQLPSRKEAHATCSAVEKDPLVEYAHVIPERYPLAARRRATANDPLLNRQWGLAAIDLFQAEQRASFPDPNGIVIAVIDSGVDASHPDLQGIFIDEQNFTRGVLKDTAGHGTHVSGIIAALRNNARGIRGVARTQSVMSLKALNPYDGPGYYRAIRHATDNGAHVANFSLGGGHDPTEEILIRRAMQRGVVIVAAMGNEKLAGNPKSYPAAIGGVIAVGASTETDGIADFSCSGTHIDLVAPGVNILSTIPTYSSSLADGTDYEAWPGTSMAAPHVAAAAALLLAKRPNLTLAQVRRALVRTADKVPGQTGFNATFGHGRLNVRSALASL